MTKPQTRPLELRLAARAAFGDACAFCHSLVDFHSSRGAARGVYIELVDDQALAVACSSCLGQLDADPDTTPNPRPTAPAAPVFRRRTLDWLHQNAHRLAPSALARVAAALNTTPPCGESQPVHARLDVHGDDFTAIVRSLRVRATGLRNDASAGHDSSYWPPATRELMARGRAASIEQAEELEAIADELEQTAVVAPCCSVRVIA